MAGFVPFAIITASISGRSVAITPATPGGTGGQGTLDSTGRDVEVLMVVNSGPGMAWCRLSTEAAPTATVNDVALPAYSVHLFANPAPNGVLGIAVIATLTTSIGNIYFIPGEGGV